MKTEVGTLNATPSKRLFLSIIADYDLNKSICELVDNALDVWSRNGRKQVIKIDIQLNEWQQTISVEDNAGGLPKSELRYIIGPGLSGNSVTDDTIGIFGVGTKRAVVALAQEIKIKTRHKKHATFEIDIDDTWLENDDWELPVYENDNIKEGTTLIELQRLRVHISEESTSQLIQHLAATYAKFLTNENVKIFVNDNSLSPIFFENWAYPPKYEPSKYNGSVSVENRTISVEAIAGLTTESSPAAGEYGVYFYCNDRLVARALKTFDVGFTKGFAGLPHPKISLTRVIVSLNGDARVMPWNSSKSDISTKHEVFLAIHDWLVEVVKDYAALSRIWMGDWPDRVFKYTEGEIKEVEIDNFHIVKKSFLPPLPKSRPRYGDVVTHENKTVASKKPWTKGLYEGVIAADLITKQRLEQKNRIALIVLDSTLEIAFKEFLVNDSGKHYDDSKLHQIFQKRHLVHNEIRSCSAVSIKEEIWKKVSHYYSLRCELIHKKATVGITDSQIQDFRSVVEGILRKLYKLKF